MHLVYPQIFCITIVFDYSWNDCKIQEKLETMAIQNFGGVNRLHYGLCENGEQGNTVEHWFQEPLYNKILSITNGIPCPRNSTMWKTTLMKRNLLIVDTICQSLGPSLYRGSTVDQFNQFLAWLARVCTLHLVHCRVQSKDSLIEAELSKTIGIYKQARHINGWTV